MAAAAAYEDEDIVKFVVKEGNGVKGLSQKGINYTPNEYIQPPEERLDPTKLLPDESLPIIDVSNWDDPEVADAICGAAENWGFFQIINHGIPMDVLESVKDAAHVFFELPVEERKKYLKENSPTHTVQLKTSFNPQVERVLEWKDVLFHIYDSSDDSSKLWPSVSRDQVLEYMKLVKPVIRKLLTLLMKGLNMKEIDDSCESTLMGTLIVNLIYYPVCPNPELTAGAGPHSDVSTITVLLQDDVGGLFVRESQGDNWIPVRPLKGALVINIGDVLQIISNDKYKSIEHRVIVSANMNRVSVPVFVNPAPDAIIKPLSEVLEGGKEPLYKEAIYGDYFNYFFSKSLQKYGATR